MKLSDFGWSSHSIDAERKTFCGTLDYLCPEMVNNKPYNYTLDIWCLGVLCFEFVTGSPPFESSNRNETMRKIKGILLSFPSYLSREVQHLITGLLQYSPEFRMSLKDIMNHPWILKHKDYKPE